MKPFYNNYMYGIGRANGYRLGEGRELELQMFKISTNDR